MNKNITVVGHGDTKKNRVAIAALPGTIAIESANKHNFANIEDINIHTLSKKQKRANAKKEQYWINKL